MKKFKVLHTADFHVRDADYEEVKKCLEFMVEKARKEKPDLFVIAGDIYDSQNIKQDSRSAKLVFNIVSRLADVAPVAIVIGTPSHDGMAAEVLAYVRAAHPIHIAARPEMIALKGGNFTPIDDFDVPNAIISLVPTPTKQFFQTTSGISTSDVEIASAMSAIFTNFGAQANAFNCPHILVGHFQRRGAQISDSQQLIGRDIEISDDQMRLANADLVCLGHIHMEQPYYCGSIYRQDYGELERKGFKIHELQPFDDKFSLLSRFIETPTRKLLKIDIDLTKHTGVIADSGIYSTYDEHELFDAFVRIEIKVFQDEAFKINKGEIREWFMSANSAKDADVRLIRIPRVQVRSQNILKLETLRDKIIERAAIVSEPVPETILAKADLLETMNPDQIIQQVAAA